MPSFRISTHRLNVGGSCGSIKPHLCSLTWERYEDVSRLNVRSRYQWKYFMYFPVLLLRSQFMYHDKFHVCMNMLHIWTFQRLWRMLGYGLLADGTQHKENLTRILHTLLSLSSPAFNQRGKNYKQLKNIWLDSWFSIYFSWILWYYEQGRNGRKKKYFARKSFQNQLRCFSKTNLQIPCTFK